MCWVNRLFMKENSLGLLAAHAADTSAIGVSRRAPRRPGHHKTGRLAVANTMTKILDPANAIGCAIPCT
jgi:hypothetical protein